ncbi:MAG: thioredoxin [Spirochaetia bacterium]
MSKEVILTKENFEAEVKQSDIPVLIDFWAEWCVPCRMVAPMLHELAEEYEGKVKIAKVNVDEQPELAEEYKIQSIPTLMVFKDGRLEKDHVGAGSKDQIEGLFKSLI